MEEEGEEEEEVVAEEFKGPLNSNRSNGPCEAVYSSAMLTNKGEEECGVDEGSSSPSTHDSLTHSTTQK